MGDGSHDRKNFDGTFKLQLKHYKKFIKKKKHKKTSSTCKLKFLSKLSFVLCQLNLNVYSEASRYNNTFHKNDNLTYTKPLLVRLQLIRIYARILYLILQETYVLDRIACEAILTNIQNIWTVRNMNKQKHFLRYHSAGFKDSL